MFLIFFVWTHLTEWRRDSDFSFKCATPRKSSSTSAPTTSTTTTQATSKSTTTKQTTTTETVNKSMKNDFCSSVTVRKMEPYASIRTFEKVDDDLWLNEAEDHAFGVVYPKVGPFWAVYINGDMSQVWSIYESRIMSCCIVTRPQWLSYSLIHMIAYFHQDSDKSVWKVYCYAKKTGSSPENNSNWQCYSNGKWKPSNGLVTCSSSARSEFYKKAPFEQS